MKGIIGPATAPICGCGKACTEKRSRIWICPECIRLAEVNAGQFTHCGVPYVGCQGSGSNQPLDFVPAQPIAGGSLKHLEAMLA